MNKFKKVALISLLALSLPALSDVNLYTTREQRLIQPVIDAFTKETGINVSYTYVKDGLAEKVLAEGKNSPADVLMVVDSGNLLELVDKGVTQKVDSKVLQERIPKQLRGQNNDWFAVTLRDRVVYAAKELDIKSITYEELSDPKWKGKICIRSGNHPYNTSLFAAMIEHEGVEFTEKWLRGLKANVARKPAGGDRDGARDIVAGICDIAVGNNYYYGKMLAEPEGSDQRKWGEGIKIIRPTFKNKGSGTHVNISGVAMAKNAPHKADAQKFMEFLVSDKAQQLYVNESFETPIVAGIPPNPIFEKLLPPLKPDYLTIQQIVKSRPKAVELVEKVGFDN